MRNTVIQGLWRKIYLHQVLGLSCSPLQNWLPTYAMLIPCRSSLQATHLWWFFLGPPHRRKVTSTTLRSVTKRWRPDRIKCCLGKSWHLSMVAWCYLVMHCLDMLAVEEDICSWAGASHRTCWLSKIETTRTGGISQYFKHRNVDGLWRCKSYGQNTNDSSYQTHHSETQSWGKCGNACTN